MKNRYTKWFGVSFLILITGTSMVVQFKGSISFSHYTVLFSPQELEQIAIEIANGLIGEAIGDSNFVKWPRIADGPPPGWLGSWNNFYYGYWWGTAGVADTLITLFDATQNQSYLKYAERAGNYLIQNAQNLSDNGIYWYGAEDYSTTYIGMKYGNAGIALFFLDLLKSTNNQTYYEPLRNSLLTLEAVAHNSSDNDTFWSYTLSGSEGVTDITYGVTGIANVFLEAGVTLNNTHWIDIAVSSGEWLTKLASKIGTDEQQEWSIPWSDFAPFNTSFFTGYGGGNAGIGSFLLSLYRSTNDSKWLDAASFIGNWLLSKQINGTWLNGGPTYITELDPNSTRYHTIAGIDSGVAGIGQFLLELYHTTADMKYAEGAIDAASWLIGHANNSDQGLKWAKTTAEPDYNTYFTGYSSGAAGIGSFFAETYSAFGCEKFKNAMLGAAEWLVSLRKDGYLFPVATGTTRHPFHLKQYGHHLGYHSGAAGVALYFLKVAESLQATPKYPEIINCSALPEFGEMLPQIYIDNQSSETTVNGQIDNDEQLLLSLLGFASVSMLLLIPILALRRKDAI
ncbi:MAG: lanthionine synthetase LanC family protein [Candidatus Heimdallarchaeota archaeon]